VSRGNNAAGENAVRGLERAGQTVTDEPAARRARRLPPPNGGRAPRRGEDAGARA
jgi:hypothetical protein